MDTKQKDTITTAVKASLKLFAGHNRGDVVSWLLIEKATGLRRHGSHWTAFVRRFKRDYLKLGFAVRAVNGTGWRILLPSEQVTRCRDDRSRRALRQIRRGENEVRAAPDAELSQHERVAKAVAVQGLRHSWKAVRQDRIRSAVLSKPTSSGIPRPVKPGA